MTRAYFSKRIANSAAGSAVATGKMRKRSIRSTPAGLEILEKARRRGMLTVCEQTIAPYAFEQRILVEERGLHPAWESEDRTSSPKSISTASGGVGLVGHHSLCLGVRASAIGACGGPVRAMSGCVLMGSI